MKQFYAENSRRNSTTLILLVKADLCIIKFYRYKEYQSTGGTSGLASSSTSAQQPSIMSFTLQTTASTSTNKEVTEHEKLYGPNHPRQKTINDAIIKHLLVGCALPISIVEDSNFRTFMEVVDGR